MMQQLSGPGALVEDRVQFQAQKLNVPLVLGDPDIPFMIYHHAYCTYTKQPPRKNTK